VGRLQHDASRQRAAKPFALKSFLRLAVTAKTDNITPALARPLANSRERPAYCWQATKPARAALNKMRTAIQSGRPPDATEAIS
jgi:hypothetical protein